MPDTQTVLGRVIHVTAMLHRRARLLAAALERDMLGALRELGMLAAHAFLALGHRSGRQPLEGDAYELAERTLRAIALDAWFERRMRPVFRNHAARTLSDTRRVLEQMTNIELLISEQDAGRIISGSAPALRMADIAPQVRAAIEQAIRDGFQAGENPIATARRIERYVPAGRFVHAGSRYRSKLIARSETLDLQRAATLAAYESQPAVVAVMLRDGVFGEPRSDAECIARDGRIVAIENARSVHALHPQCTLSLNPVIAGIPAPEPLPEPGELEPVPAYA